MNNNNYVEFKKERDLGSIITDTFKFLRLEWKPFFTTIFKIGIVPILLAIAGILYYSFEQSNLYSSVDYSNPDNIPTSPFTGGLLVATLVMLVSYVVAYIMINVASMYYIKSYIDNNGNASFDEVKQNVKDNFWSFTGLGVLVFILVLIGTLLCFIPGVYVGVILALTSSIYVFKGKDVMDTIGYAFEFIKGHWWTTFGVLIVMGLLVAVLSSIFSIPAMIYSMVKMMSGISENDPSKIFSMFSDPVYIIMTIISYIGRFLFYAVSLVSTVLIYFDINEQKYASGTIEKIDSLGK